MRAAGRLSIACSAAALACLGVATPAFAYPVANAPSHTETFTTAANGVSSHLCGSHYNPGATLTFTGSGAFTPTAKTAVAGSDGTGCVDVIPPAQTVNNTYTVSGTSTYTKNGSPVTEPVVVSFPTLARYNAVQASAVTVHPINKDELELCATNYQSNSSVTIMASESSSKAPGTLAIPAGTTTGTICTTSFALPAKTTTFTLAGYNAAGAAQTSAINVTSTGGFTPAAAIGPLRSATKLPVNDLIAIIAFAAMLLGGSAVARRVSRRRH